MFNISSFLQKFSKNISDNEILRKQIAEIIEKHIEVRLAPEEIEIKNYIAFIKSSPGIKNKVFIYKPQILEEIQKTLSYKIVDLK